MQTNATDPPWFKFESRRLLPPFASCSVPFKKGTARQKPASTIAGREGTVMPIARTREVTASSRDSFQGAIEQGVTRALASHRNIEGVVVQEQKVLVEDRKISCYRVTLKVILVITD
jgi:dodecin